MTSAKSVPNSRNRIEVTKAQPCPICGRPNQCYALPGDGLLACKKIGLNYGDELPNGYKWTSKQDSQGTYYIGTVESQQRYKEQNKAQNKKLIDKKTWKYSVLTVDDNGTYKESAKHDWYKTKKIYEDGKDYFQYGYRKRGEESIKKDDLDKGEFIGLYTNYMNLPFASLPDLLNGKWNEFISFFAKGIIILEGEKCVDCFNKESEVKFKSDTHIFPHFLALTSIGGAGSLSPEDIQMYRKIAENNPSTPIVLSPDFDKPGYQHIRRIYEALKDLPNPMCIVDWTKLPGLPDKKFDMADYFEKFGEALKTLTVEEFIESLTVSPDEFDWDKFTSKTDTGSVDLASALGIKNLGDALINESLDINWIVDDLLVEGTSTLLAAQEKTGKTCLLLDLMASIYSGENFLGKKVEQGKVLYINCDSSERTFKKQASDRWEELNNNLPYIQDWSPSDENIELLAEYCKKNPGTLIGIDSLRVLCYERNIDENSSEVGELIKKISRAIVDNNCTVIFLHHISKNQNNKGTHRVSGHTSIGSTPDQVWMLSQGSDGVRKLESKGSRYTERFKISYNETENRKCQPIAVNPNNDDEYEYQGTSDGTGDTLEGQIKALLTKADRKLTTREIIDSTGASQQTVNKALNKALKTATWLRSEKDGKNRVYWTENFHLQPTTYNHHPVGEPVVDVVVDASKADTERIPTDELKSSCRSVVDVVVDENDVSDATVQTQPVNEDVATNTQLSLFEFPAETKTTKELSELEKAVLDAFGMLPLKPQAEMTIKVKLAGIDPDKWDNLSREDVTQALTNLTPDFLEQIEDKWKLK